MAVCFAALGWPGMSASAPVALFLSDRTPAYLSVSEAMHTELAGATKAVELLWNEAEGLREAPRISVAVGMRACTTIAMLDVPTPLLCVLLPRSAFESAAAAAPKGRALTAIYLDQPPSRQLLLIRLALPAVREVGVLLGPESSRMEQPLRLAAAAKGLQIETASVRRAGDLYAALEELLDGTNVLLALPDPVVFNSGTAQNILRSAFYRRVPILAFAPSYARAGAALALYTTPEQVGRQAGVWVRRYLKGAPLPAPQHSVDFTISVNERVARAQGIRFLDAAAMEEHLRKQERAR